MKPQITRRLRSPAARRCRRRRRPGAWALAPKAARSNATAAAARSIAQRPAESAVMPDRVAPLPAPWHGWARASRAGWNVGGPCQDGGMKFTVERDALAEAVAWVARALPSRPVVPVLTGLLLSADQEDQPGQAEAGLPHPLLLRLRGVGAGQGPRRGGGARHLPGARPSARGDRPLPAAAPGRVRRRPRRRLRDLRRRGLHADAAAARRVPAAAGAAAAGGHGGRRRARHGDRPGDPGRQPRRHAADAHRRQRRARRQDDDAGRDRPLPARRQGPGLEPGTGRGRPGQDRAPRAGQDAERRGQDDEPRHGGPGHAAPGRRRARRRAAGRSGPGRPRP